jgi:hypothetical protein
VQGHVALWRLHLVRQRVGLSPKTRRCGIMWCHALLAGWSGFYLAACRQNFTRFASPNVPAVGVRVYAVSPNTVPLCCVAIVPLSASPPTRPYQHHQKEEYIFYKHIYSYGPPPEAPRPNCGPGTGRRARAGTPLLPPNSAPPTQQAQLVGTQAGRPHVGGVRRPPARLWRPLLARHHLQRPGARARARRSSATVILRRPSAASPGAAHQADRLAYAHLLSPPSSCCVVSCRVVRCGSPFLDSGKLVQP